MPRIKTGTPPISPRKQRVFRIGPQRSRARSGEAYLSWYYECDVSASIGSFTRSVGNLLRRNEIQQGGGGEMVGAEACTFWTGCSPAGPPPLTTLSMEMVISNSFLAPVQAIVTRQAQRPAV